MTLKPFIPRLALAGHPIATRSGFLAIMCGENPDPAIPGAMVVKVCDMPYYYDRFGKLAAKNPNHDMDLFLIDKTVRYWFNVYRDTDGNYSLGPKHSCVESAVANKGDPMYYIKTIQLEVEE